ncbi:Histidine kinase [Sulfitobacter guttiformis KCTC 32187]|uniref:histidine kinase n=2 Tax=Sulfitobacter guttiformis TaxID=74349 RepID=A0A420DKA5_9RHOB|nr:Histidine kinase [Sulfitobacter guttiformis KCTC 32187]RKE94628.1 histidine kinase [Sulfitobacter guttiformis]
MFRGRFSISNNAADLLTVERRLKDYANVGRHLLMQRVVIYLLAITLSGVYYDLDIAIFFLILIAMYEAFDTYVFHLIIQRKTWRPRNIWNAVVILHIGTLVSSIIISAFSISIALQQGVNNSHFLPMFMLVSASIFAAMNNHHFLSVLALRLIIYVFSILFIPAYDLWVVQPPLSSELWLNLFTIIFVLGFIMELGRNFLAGYTRTLRAREKLEKEHKITKAALEAKTRFLATVNHELRTPLTSIKGAFDLINAGSLGPVPQKMERLLEIASRNTCRLKELVDDLLFLQASDIGKIKFNFQKLDMHDLVEEAVERFQPHATQMNIALNVQCAADEFWVCADKKRIDQVLMNLLSNAAKFSKPNGTITVALEENADLIRLSVRDDGIGIQDGSEELVFAEFIQLDSRDGREYGGSGLGLSISKKIVEAHQGNIGFNSELGVGTEFFVELERYH